MANHITHAKISVENYGDNHASLAYVYESIFVSQIGSRSAAQTNDGEEVINDSMF